MINGPPNCVGCVAANGDTIYQPGHRYAGRTGYVPICLVLRDEGGCQLQVARDLADRQIAAMNNLADALREQRAPISLVPG